MTFTKPENDGRRVAREKRTIAAMIDIYCKSRHAAAPPCDECRELLEYAYCRLERCPFGEDKSTCNRCPVHCYRPDRRERIRQVMRFAGPRMLYRHPVLAILHWYDEFRGRGKLGSAEE
jgi:hypothetical protein